MRPTTTLELGFFRTAASGFSPMPITSGASWISRRLRSTSGWRRELGLDDGRAADQLDHELVGQARKRLQHPGDLGLWRLVASHRVHGDANHAQASSTSTCFLPR